MNAINENQLNFLNDLHKVAVAISRKRLISNDLRVSDKPFEADETSIQSILDCFLQRCLEHRNYLSLHPSLTLEIEKNILFSLNKITKQKFEKKIDETAKKIEDLLPKIPENYLECTQGLKEGLDLCSLSTKEAKKITQTIEKIIRMMKESPHKYHLSYKATKNQETETYAREIVLSTWTFHRTKGFQCITKSYPISHTLSILHEKFLVRDMILDIPSAIVGRGGIHQNISLSLSCFTKKLLVHKIYRITPDEIIFKFIKSITNKNIDGLIPIHYTKTALAQKIFLFYEAKLFADLSNFLWATGNDPFWSFQQTISLALDLLKGLSYLHSYSICDTSQPEAPPFFLSHGDVKLSNIMLEQSETGFLRARLIDFDGLSPYSLITSPTGLLPPETIDEIISVKKDPEKIGFYQNFRKEFGQKKDIWEIALIISILLRGSHIKEISQEENRAVKQLPYIRSIIDVQEEWIEKKPPKTGYFLEVGTKDITQKAMDESLDELNILCKERFPTENEEKMEKISTVLKRMLRIDYAERIASPLALEELQTL